MGSGSAFNTATNDVYANMRVIRNNVSNSDGMYIGYANANSGATRIYGGGATSGGIRISGSGNNDIKMGTGSGTAWHSANDGSGSGLDADTLDGYNTLENGANVVLRSNGAGYLNISNWINVAGTGFYSSTYGNHFHVEDNGYIARSGNSTATQIKFQTNDSSITTRGYVYANSSNYIGFLNNGASWLLQARSDGNLYKGDGQGLIWHAANDGSGSGLDADTLDG